MNAEEYTSFVAALLAAEKVPARDFEKMIHFEGCMPVEEIAQRGLDTLRFGPMKPVGLQDPRTGAEPHAVVQLRLENREATMYNLVGFQTKLTYPEQRRIFRMIPGLENADFVRLGSMHRNTYINAPQLLLPTLQMKQEPRILFAGPDYRCRGLCGIGRQRLSGRDQRRPPCLRDIADLPASRHRNGKPGRSYHQYRQQGLSADECELRPVSSPFRAG